MRNQGYLADSHAVHMFHEKPVSPTSSQAVDSARKESSMSQSVKSLNCAISHWEVLGGDAVGDAVAMLGDLRL